MDILNIFIESERNDTGANFVARYGNCLVSKILLAEANLYIQCEISYVRIQ